MMNLQSYSVRALIVVAVATSSGLAVSSGASATPSPHATASASCNISKVARKLGPTYVTSLKVFRTSCRAGVSTVKAFHHCRMATGRRGRCHKPVHGYRCSEVRGGIKTQFSGRVTCHKGKATVYHTYTQFT